MEKVFLVEIKKDGKKQNVIIFAENYSQAEKAALENAKDFYHVGQTEM